MFCFWNCNVYVSIAYVEQGCVQSLSQDWETGNRVDGKEHNALKKKSSIVRTYSQTRAFIANHARRSALALYHSPQTLILTICSRHYKL